MKITKEKVIRKTEIVREATKKIGGVSEAIRKTEQVREAAQERIEVVKEVVPDLRKAKINHQNQSSQNSRMSLSEATYRSIRYLLKKKMREIRTNLTMPKVQR